MASGFLASSGSVFNGGRSQIGFNFLQGGGEYPFLNLFKIGQAGGFAGVLTTPDKCDTDGYPTTLSPGTFTISSGISIPTQTERAGNYVLAWTGIGTLSLVSGTAITYSVTTASKAAQCVVTLSTLTVGNGPAPLAVGQEIVISGATGTGWNILNARQTITAIDATGLLITINLNTSAVSGTLGGTITAANSLQSVGTFGRCVYTPTSTTNQGASITALPGPGTINNCRLYHIDDETALNAGQIFNEQFKQRLSRGNFGVLRFMNWQVNNYTNTTTWDIGNRPTTYFQYQGAQWRSDLLCNLAGSGITTASGGDYTVSAPTTWTGTAGQDPPDKATIHLVYNASSPTRGTVTFDGGGSANINWSAGGTFPTVGNQIFFDQSGGAAPTELTVETGGQVPYFPIQNAAGTLSALYYVVAANSGTGKIQVSATSGGSAITFASAGTGTTTGRILPTVAIGGTNRKPILDRNGQPMTPSGFGYPTGGTFNSINTLTYDAVIGAWLGGSASRGGIENGVPVSIMVQLCNEVGAHPWFCMPAYALTPMSDYVTQLATYVKSAGRSWMIPRYETPNETWNGFIGKGYGSAVSKMYGWAIPGNSGDWPNWQGKVLSTIGQAVNAVYGGSPTAGTLYQVVCGVQSASFNGTASASSLDPLFASTKYIGTTPQSGYSSTVGVAEGWRWATTVCSASYLQPGMFGYNSEIPLAFAYYVTNSGNASAQAANAETYMASLVGGGTCTFSNGSTDVSCTGHGFVANQQIMFNMSGSLPSPLVFGDILYVLSAGLTANTFRVATSPGGSAITMNAAGSASYMATPGVYSIPWFARNNLNVATWASGFSIKYLTEYEGTYGDGAAGFDSANAVTSTITGATNAASCVFTISTSNNQSQHSPPTQQNAAGNAATAAGMYLKLSGLTGNFSGFNTQTVQVTAVSADGTQITTNLDSSGVGAFSGSGTFTYYCDAGATVPMSTALIALRYAGALANGLRTYTMTHYSNVAAISVSGCTGQFPSQYLLGGGQLWSAQEPNVYAADSPRFSAMKAFNS